MSAHVGTETLSLYVLLVSIHTTHQCMNKQAYMSSSHRAAHILNEICSCGNIANNEYSVLHLCSYVNTIQYTHH